MNLTIIMGHLGKDPELRYTQSQTPVTSFSVAVGEKHKNAQGEMIESTEWFEVVAWKAQAENCAKYLQKGAQVLVEGKMKTRTWEDQQGAKRYNTELIAHNVTFLSRNTQSDNNQSDGYNYQQDGYQEPSVDDVPF